MTVIDSEFKGYEKEFNLSREIIRDSENVDVLLKGSVKEFTNIHIEDLDWLWEIHPKIYNRIVAKFKERAGEKLI